MFFLEQCYGNLFRRYRAELLLWATKVPILRRPRRLRSVGAFWLKLFQIVESVPP